MDNINARDRILETVITSYSIHYTKLYEILNINQKLLYYHLVFQLSSYNLRNNFVQHTLYEVIRATGPITTASPNRKKALPPLPRLCRENRVFRKLSAATPNPFLRLPIQSFFIIFVITSYSIHYTKLYEPPCWRPGV